MTSYLSPHRTAWALLALAALILPVPVPAQEASGEPAAEAKLSVERAAIATGIEDHEPVGEGTSFPSDVGELVCFTKIVGATEDTAVTHVWLMGEEEKARVELPVRSSAWRTHSRKTIPAGWAGDWTVKVEDAGGQVLEELAFTVGGSGAGEGSGDDGEEPTGDGGSTGR